MSTGRRVAKNLFALFIGEAVSSGLAFLITILLARRLGDEGFGRLAFVQAMMVYFTLLTDMGLSTFGAREIARMPEKAAEIAGRIFSIRLTFALVLIVLFSAGLWFYPVPAEMKWLCFGSILALLTQALNPEFAFQGTERMSGIAAWRIGVHAFYLLMIFFLVGGRSDLWQVPFYRLAAESIVILLLAWITWRFLRSGARWRFQPAVWKSYLKESAVMAASVVVIKLYYTFDTFMLGIMDRPEAVGWYNAAYKIVFLFNGITVLVQIAFAPQFSRYFMDKEEMQNILEKYGFLLTYLGAISSIPLIIVNKELIGLIYGIKYFGAEEPLLYLSLSLYLVFLFSIFLSPMLYSGKQRKYLKYLFIGAIINISINFILIPFFSLIGAAITIILSNLCLFIMVSRDYFEEFNNNKLLFKIAQLVAFSFLLLYISKLIFINNWESCIFFILVFSFLSYLLNRNMITQAINLFLNEK